MFSTMLMLALGVGTTFKGADTVSFIAPAERGSKALAVGDWVNTIRGEASASSLSTLSSLYNPVKSFRFSF